MALMLHADRWIVLHWYWGHRHHFDYILAVALFFWVPAFLLSIVSARWIRKNPELHLRAFNLVRAVGGKWPFVFPLAAAIFFSLTAGLDDWWDGPVQIVWAYRWTIVLSCLCGWLILTLLDLRWIGDRFRIELKTRKIAGFHVHCRLNRENSAAFKDWLPTALLQSYSMGMAQVDMTSFLLHKSSRRNAVLRSIPESLFTADGVELRWSAEQRACRPLAGLPAFSYWRRFGRNRREIAGKLWPWWRRWLAVVYWPQGTVTIRMRKA